MSPFVHGLLAWLFAAAFIEKVLDRRLVVVAGAFSDIDGVFIFFNRELYGNYHHTFGHSYVMGLPVALALTLFAKDKKKVFPACIIVFTIHLISDIVGSNWAIYPFYPLNDFHVTIRSYVSNHLIYDVINPVVTAAAFLIMIVIIYKKEISPVEFLSEKLDKKLVGLYIFPFKYKCEICGKWAFIKCDECKRKVCSEHIEKFAKWRCSLCGNGEKKRQNQRKKMRGTRHLPQSHQDNLPPSSSKTSGQSQQQPQPSKPSRQKRQSHSFSTELPDHDEENKEKNIPTQHQTQQTPQKPGRQIPSKVKCPKCSNVVPVNKSKTTPDGKVRIECPGRGTKGSI